MNRGNFLRSLFVLAASPKVIAEINLTPKPTSLLFNDLNFTIPDYIPALISKYGNNDYEWWLSTYGEIKTSEHKNAKEFFHNEMGITI